MEKNKKSYKTLFLQKLILGQKTDLKNPEKVILKCIKLAYKDMLTAGRFYLSNDIKNNVESRCNEFKSILEKADYIYSRKIIEDTCQILSKNEIIGSGNKYATRYGLAQKLVNMTYKYLYVYYDYIQKGIDFSNCDCPLDSVILGKKELKSKGYIWSKLTKNDYLDCQQIISKSLQKENLDAELKKLGNLAYDFLNW